VNGQDGYYYTYCLRQRDHATIVARAPVGDPSPGHWLKYFNGTWSEPGLGGDASKLAGVGTSVARWTTTGETVDLHEVAGGGGPGLLFSRDHTTFSALREPLLVLDHGTWSRPAPSELLAYTDLIDARDGSNQLGNAWLLVYTYLQPNEGFNKRYLVFRPVDVSISPTPVRPQVGVLLAHWYNPALHDHWSTTAAVPDDHGAYTLEAQSGFLMTAVDPANPSVALEDCVSQWPGHPDHILIQKGVCESHGYQRLRTAGWVYQHQEPDTQPLYRCYSEAEHSHFASNRSDCDGRGTKETLLGYDLTQ